MARIQRFSDEDLWSIALKHSSSFTSVGEWNTYAKEHGLPHSQTFIQRLGSWNGIKERLNLNVNMQHRPVKYEVDELISILKKHKEAYKSVSAWNQYASKHKLPTHKVFEKYLGIEQLEKMTGLTQSYTLKSLREEILNYFPDRPPTYAEWNELTKNKPIVSSSTIVRHFGSWSNMKARIYKE
ncbi:MULTISPECIES: hypothetical protein [Bacillus]|uniref:hypothetical protein n=1 Tax=Bacillus TaxID=1386 RepID=UPI00273D415D|nr:hypothetical protein [Bacillus sp. MMSF_3328]